MKIVTRNVPTTITPENALKDTSNIFLLRIDGRWFKLHCVEFDHDPVRATKYAWVSLWNTANWADGSHDSKEDALAIMDGHGVAIYCCENTIDMAQTILDQTEDR